jgi:hypothetical protein
MRVTRRLMVVGFSLSIAGHSVIVSGSAQEAAQQAAGDEAPFGLRWRMSTAEARTIGVSLEEQKTERPNGAVFTATGLPKVISGLRQVALNFGFNDKLFRIVAVGRPFENDPQGLAVQQRYNELVAALEARYGKGVSHHDHDRMYPAPETFVMGLAAGRASYYTDFKTKDVAVRIGIYATNRTDSYYALSYDFLPLSQQYEADKRARERDAL